MVSVIIPAYNREKTIEMAINSVLDQTYKDLEVIVVDDCSKDNTVDVVKKMDDARIRVVVCEKNGGACKARNIGIGLAKGNIIAFHDSDDFWHKDKLEKSLYYLEKENADFVFSALYREGEKGHEERRIVPFYNLNDEDNKLLKLLLVNCVSTQTIVAKREVFETVRFDDAFPRFQDWDLALQVVKSGYSVYYIEEPLVDCFVMENSIMSDDVKALKALSLLEEKYKDDLNTDKKTKESFYFRSACFYEKAGRNGANYFLKAYHADRNPVMLLRFILAKIRLYKYIGELGNKIGKK